MAIKLREKKLSNGKYSLYLEYNFNGKRKYEFLKLYLTHKRTDKDDDKETVMTAQRILKEREFQIALSEAGLPDIRKRKADFIIYFKNKVDSEKGGVRSWVSAYKKLIEYVGTGNQLTFAQLTKEWFPGYIKYLNENVGARTAYNYMKCMNTILNEAVTEEIIQVNPYKTLPKHKRLKLPSTKREFLTIDELNTMYNTNTNIPEQTKTAFLLSCFCGARWHNIANLKWSELIYISEKWHLKLFVKGGKWQYLPLSEQAYDLLMKRKLRAQKEVDNVRYKGLTEYVFPYLVCPKNDTHINVRTNKQIKKWAKAAGITKNIHFHIARHTFATLLLTFETKIYTASKLLGHSSIQTTQIYANIVDQTKIDAVGKLPTIANAV